MSLRKQALTGVFWTFIEQFSNQLTGFILSLFLMRLLTPYDFGLMAMIYVFFTIANVILDSGLNYSLIRTIDANENDFSTVFYFNLFVGLLLFIILYFLAPYIALFFKQGILTKIIRVFSFSFIISSISSVQNTIFIKQLKFKRIMFISLTSNIIGGGVGICMAIYGFNVWSIVFSSLISLFLTSLFLWIYSNWKPKLYFNYGILKTHLDFGYKISLTNLSDVIFRNMYNMLLGKTYNPEVLGFYSRAESLKKLSVYSLITAINKVAFPLLSSQIDSNIVNENNKRIIQITSFITTPFLFSLVIFAEPIIIVLFTEKWRLIIPYFQILLISGVLFPMSSFNVNILTIKGRSDLVLKIEIINKTVLVVCLLMSIKFGIYMILFSQILFSILEYINNIVLGKNISEYNLKNQFLDYIPILIITMLTCLISYTIDIYILNLGFNYFGRLLVGLPLFYIIYLLFSNFSNLKNFLLLKQLFRKQ